jgi:hypothetical protein
MVTLLRGSLTAAVDDGVVASMGEEGNGMTGPAGCTSAGSHGPATGLLRYSVSMWLASV